MESGEIFISGFLTSGIEPEPRDSYTSTNHSTKLSSSLVTVWRQNCHKTWSLSLDFWNPEKCLSLYLWFRESNVIKLDCSFVEWLALVYKPRGSGSIPEVRNLEMNISPDSITRSASETESQLLNVRPSIGQYPCRNCFSSLRAIEDEPHRSSVRLPSDRKPMAHISAVTAVCSYATFRRLLVGATLTSTPSRSLAGCRIIRPLRRKVLSVPTWPRDTAEILTSIVDSFLGVTALPIPGRPTVTVSDPVVWGALAVDDCASSWASLPL